MKLFAIVLVSAPVVVGASTLAPSPSPTPVVISDHSLAEFAARGRLVTPVLSGPVPTMAPDPGLEPYVAAQRRQQRRRAEWRRRLAAQLSEIRRLETAVEEQRAEAGWLWIRYVRCEKKATREGRIRPEMEAARERLAELEDELEAARREDARLRLAARRAGALPGWFRGLEAELDE